MAQLLRDNAADARVADDVLALAAAYDERGVAATEAAVEAAVQDDMARLAEAFAEPPAGEAWWRATTAQILRYRWWVATALAIVLVLLFVHPAPLPLGGDEAGTSLIPTSDSQHAAVTTPSVVPDVSVADPFDFSIATPAPDFDTPSDTSSSFDTTPVTYAPAPTQLRITQSGYASQFAPTPAEQQPADGGLPVQTVAGQVMRYSYVRLSGSGASLKLKATGTDAANAATVRVQLCHITTANWKPSRATPMSEAPKYNEECLEGKGTPGGTWTFNFSSVQNPVDPNGWAIVPITADSATFNVTYAPTAQS